jgi:hypothetical protein
VGFNTRLYLYAGFAFTFVFSHPFASCTVQSWLLVSSENVLRLDGGEHTQKLQTLKNHDDACTSRRIVFYGYTLPPNVLIKVHVKLVAGAAFLNVLFRCDILHLAANRPEVAFVAHRYLFGLGNRDEPI